jgi:hypothetical protein
LAQKVEKGVFSQKPTARYQAIAIHAVTKMAGGFKANKPFRISKTQTHAKANKPFRISGYFLHKAN